MEKWLHKPFSLNPLHGRHCHGTTTDLDRRSQYPYCLAIPPTKPTGTGSILDRTALPFPVKVHRDPCCLYVQYSFVHHFPTMKYSPLSIIQSLNRTKRWRNTMRDNLIVCSIKLSHDSASVSTLFYEISVPVITQHFLIFLHLDIFLALFR